eukprot:scaffold107222_cov14-Tisochrysis_lutea.AAC.1
MGVKRACWQSGRRDLCKLQDLQDDKHALSLCNCACICALRNKHAHLFLDTPPQPRVFCLAGSSYTTWLKAKTQTKTKLMHTRRARKKELSTIAKMPRALRKGP